MEFDSNINTLLKNGLEKLEINYNSITLEKLLKYMNLLIEINKKINLTSITEPKEVVTKHLLDSLVIIPLLNKLFTDNINIIDIGTGPGLPGIPIKIVRQKDEITLVDSTRKKVNFLNEVCHRLHLNNVLCLHSRAEDLARDEKYREKYQIVLSRALAPMNILLELCMPFVKTNGFFFAYKSKNVYNELKEADKALNLLGGRLIEVFNCSVLGDDITRNIVIIRKISRTPDKYPRRAGIPQKKPIQ